MMQYKVICVTGWLSFFVYRRLERRLNECFDQGWELDPRSLCNDQGWIKSKFLILLRRGY